MTTLHQVHADEVPYASRCVDAIKAKKVGPQRGVPISKSGPDQREWAKRAHKDSHRVEMVVGIVRMERVDSIAHAVLENEQELGDSVGSCDRPTTTLPDGAEWPRRLECAQDADVDQLATRRGGDAAD